MGLAARSCGLWGGEDLGMGMGMGREKRGLGDDNIGMLDGGLRIGCEEVTVGSYDCYHAFPHMFGFNPHAWLSLHILEALL